MRKSYEDLCLKVCKIAKETGKFIAGERLSFDESKVELKGLHDLVSYVDKNSEKYITEQLSELLPEAGFIVEEGTIDQKGERFNWIVDPLDGTTNFVQGVPVYAVSIALMDNNELVVGVIYEIGRNECFYTWKGGGSFLNDKPIYVSKRNRIQDALLATGFPYSAFDRLDEYMKFLKWTFIETRGVRRLGSAATDLAYVACGRFDAFWEYNLKPWDMAAGALLIQEAGGTITDFKGGNNYLFGKEAVATNGLLDKIMLPKLQELMQIEQK